MHYFYALFLCFTVAIYIFPVALFSILHSFHVTVFLYCTNSMFHFFRPAIFYMLYYFMWYFYMLQCFRFAFLSCCTFCIFQFFPVALCLCCTFPRVVARAPTNIKYSCKALHLRCLWSPCYPSTVSMLRIFHLVLFPCCTFQYCNLFMLRFFNIDKN